MATAKPTFGLRPMLLEDVPVLAEIFRASIEGLTDDDYSLEQQEAWASAAEDEKAFGVRLTEQLTLIGNMNGGPVGFASLKDNQVLDMVYVHPAVAGQGVASMLVDALERLAGARGARRLTTEASDTAYGFFQKRGFTAEKRSTVMRGGEWLSSTTMVKQLPPAEATGEGA